MLQVVQEKEISHPGRRGSTRDQLPSEGLWLPAGESWRGSWSRVKMDLFRDTHSIVRMWTLSEGERAQGMGLLIVMVWVISYDNKWDEYSCYSREGTGIFKNWTAAHFWNGAGPYGPCPPCPLPTFCLWKIFSQKICLIPEVRTCRYQEKQLKETK